MADQLGDAFCHHVGYHDGHPVASSIVVLGNSAHDTRGAMDRDRAAPVRANEVVQAHAVRLAIEEGCRHYHLGESGESDSLAHSKSKFGAVGYPYDEIRIERLPLTRVDTLARNAVKKVIGFCDT